MNGSLRLLTYLSPESMKGINYPGEARYLALMPGPSNEIWYDDGGYTGLTRFTLSTFLVQTDLTVCAPLFIQRGASFPGYWFLLDQQMQAVFLGTRETITAFLQQCDASTVIYASL